MVCALVCARAPQNRALGKEFNASILPFEGAMVGKGVLDNYGNYGASGLAAVDESCECTPPLLAAWRGGVKDTGRRTAQCSLSLVRPVVHCQAGKAADRSLSRSVSLSVHLPVCLSVSPSRPPLDRFQHLLCVRSCRSSSFHCARVFPEEPWSDRRAGTWRPGPSLWRSGLLS
jgi:hypothetical protein